MNSRTWPVKAYCAHAVKALPDSYRRAVKLAASETGLASEAFPAECPYTLDQLLAIELPALTVAADKPMSRFVSRLHDRDYQFDGHAWYSLADNMRASEAIRQELES